MVQFVQRWQALRSQSDEAINALWAAKQLKLTLFRRNLLVDPSKTFLVFAYALISLVGLAVTAVLLYRYGVSKEFFINSFEYARIVSFGWFPQLNVDWSNMSDTLDVRSDLLSFWKNPLYMVIDLITLPIVTLIFFGIVWLGISLVGLAAYLIGFPTSWILNRITANQVRRTAFGNDTIGEEVMKVAGVPEGCGENCGLVPDQIEVALAAFSD